MTSTFLVSVLGLGLLTSCASNIQKEALPADISPKEAISQTEQLQEMARRDQADVLAYEDFKRGSDYLEEAQESLKDQDDAQEVIDNAAYAQAYFKQSIANSDGSTQNYDSILSARASSVAAGAFSYWDTSEKMREVDSDLIDRTDSFTAPLAPVETAQLQKRYLETEVMSIQERELGKAENVISLLDKKDASNLAPQSFKKAQRDVLLSKNLIAKSPRNPEIYNQSVYQAIKSTVMLRDVMNAISENGPKTPEAAAIKIVMQNRKLGKVKGDIALLSSAVMNQADQIAFQNAMNNVRKFFSEDEAEVYQQGDKLLIRLKKIDFPVGKATIPGQAKDLLVKINTIVGGLNPSQVEIQGHTDSTGSKSVNERLSLQRAKNVAKFFRQQGLATDIKSDGFGPNKPLADNKTKQGRAMNRRVDLLISTEKDHQIYSE